MTKTTIPILLLCAAALLPAGLDAQTAVPMLADSTIAVRNLKVEPTDRTLVLDMDLCLDSLHLRPNRRMVFTPTVSGGDGYTRLMPPIVLNGRKQSISYKRFAHNDYGPDALAVYRRNGTRQTVHYSAVLPYEPWMKNCDVAIEEDLCGCGDVLDQAVTPLRRLRRPRMPYVRPAVEGPKERHYDGQAFIDFPVDKITLYPDYRANPTELAKIVNSINVVKNDTNATIYRVEIHGYASPEDTYRHNTYLAENRARTLTDYVRRMVALPDTTFRVSSTPEDWEGLRRYVEGSNLDNREAILALIDDATLDPDVKEHRIRDRYPDDYRFMLQTWYPALRHSDYVVRYYVRPFTVDEAREIIRTKPQQLSLEEMYALAQTYEPGTPRFNEVMETAVRMFPDDPTANLNAACARMEVGDYEGAEHFLRRAGRSPQADHARGVLLVLHGDTDGGCRLMRQAQEAGCREAGDNLRLIEGPATTAPADDRHSETDTD